MKTLKSISLSILLFAIVAIASANETTKMLISSTDDLKNSFREKIVKDFTESTGYLYQNDVSRMNEDVEVIFLITNDKTVRVLSTKCKNQIASDYVKQLLDKQQINVSTDMIGMVYKIDLKLFYKAN
jgi:hypothetical protein